MRRTKLVLAAAAVMVALLVAFAAPAMAKGNGHDNNNGNHNNNGNDSHLDRQDIRLDNQLLNNRFDNFNNFSNFNRFDDNLGFVRFDDFGFNNFNRFDDNDLEFSNFNRCFNFPFCNDFGNESHGAVSGGTIIINRT